MSVAWVQLGLGRYRFSVATAAYQSFRRTASHRWASAERIGRSPARQHVGPAAQTVEIEGVILAGYDYAVASWAQLPLMRADAARGEPLMLVDGLGQVWGRWCVERIEESQSVFFADGAPRRIDFRLALTEYGEDGPAQGGIFSAGLALPGGGLPL